MGMASAVRERLPTRSQWAPIALWLLGWLAFAVIAGLAAASSRFPADLWISHRLQDISSPAFDNALDLPETLADFPFLLAIFLPALVLLWLLHHRREAIILLLTPLGWLPNTAVKALVDRPRPSPHLVRIIGEASGPSFPSGHTITAVLIFGLLLFLATILVHRPWLRLPLQLACLYAILFTALARIYHGAHWPSDILGSALLGSLILAFFVWAHRHLMGKA